MRRIYFLLPSVALAKVIVDELLLARKARRALWATPAMQEKLGLRNDPHASKGAVAIPPNTSAMANHRAGGRGGCYAFQITARERRCSKL